MALQSSGAISLSQIQSEFGGSNPISLSEYYQNASPDLVTSNNTGVPNTGNPISMSNFYGTVKGTSVYFEIIGAGAGGGAGDGSPGLGSDGGDSTITYTVAGAGSSTTITSDGGTAYSGKQTGWGDGSRSYYGAGGAGGANSDSNNQTSGYSPAATSYGAGGGGGGAHTFAERNGGIGGGAGGTNGTAYTVSAWNSGSTLTRYEGTPTTNTILMEPGSTVTIVIGTGGAGASGNTSGAKGADGYCKLTVGGTDYEYTATGSHTFTVPS